MHEKLLRASLSAASVLFAVGCSSGGVEGDTCIATSYCAGGFQCRGGACREVPAPFETFDKVCIEDECAQDADCPTGQTCPAGKCNCSNHADCGGPPPYCENSECVGCRDADDCGTGQVCDAGTCRNECTNDYECPTFFGCQSGICTLTGCTNDRECVRVKLPPKFVSDSRAFCSQSESPPACRIPCRGELDCNSGGAADYEHMTCTTDGYCKAIGCADDTECKACPSNSGDVCAGINLGSNYAVHCVDSSTVQ